jgi:L-threonylcarbamoyladenylate synthase
MQRLVVNATHPEFEALATAADVLRRGGIVALPTDTLYGLAVDPRRSDAVERVFLLKGRDSTTAIPLIAANLDQALTAAKLGAREQRAAAVFWPGPLSIVAAANPGVSSNALAGGSTVAIRVPAHAVASGLARAFGFPVTATSANRSGERAADSADAVADALPEVDLLLDAGRAPGGAPSTIISFDADGPILVRAGAVPWERVLKSLQ